MRIVWWSYRDRVAMVVAVLLPLGVAAGLAPFRGSFPNTDAALALVAAVVLVATNGHRFAGLLASVSSAVCFDFFLTAPYERFTITHRNDIETTVLLLAVGAAVTELAVRGRRDRRLARADEVYLGALASTVDLINSGQAGAALLAHVNDRLVELLQLRDCRFEAGRFGGLLRLDRDGLVRGPGGEWDIDQFGMPNADIELVVASGGLADGRFVLNPTPGVTPTLVARRISAVLASQVAGARLARTAHAA